MTEEEEDAFFADAYGKGYKAGLTAGKEAESDALQAAYSRGREDGRAEGYAQGHEEGGAEGYAEGMADGKEEGYRAGYDEGHTEGFNDGSTEGFAAGRLAHEPRPTTQTFWSAQALIRMGDGGVGVGTWALDDTHPVLWAADHGRHLISYHEIPKDVYEALRAHKNAVEAKP